MPFCESEFGTLKKNTGCNYSLIKDQVQNLGTEGPCPGHSSLPQELLTFTLEKITIPEEVQAPGTLEPCVMSTGKAT